VSRLSNAGGKQVARTSHPDRTFGAPDFREPRFIRRVVGEVIGVPLDGQAAGLQNHAKLFAEVAVGEIDAAQAARS
jgi:hypothetical protein